MSIYTEAVKLGIPLDNHESDLYLKVTAQSARLVAEHDKRGTSSVFRSNIDGALWYDVPFAFDPWWEKRCARSS